MFFISIGFMKLINIFGYLLILSPVSSVILITIYSKSDYLLNSIGKIKSLVTKRPPLTLEELQKIQLELDEQIKQIN